jgi:GNAT superfamily N-acetyltransferase
MVDRLDVDNVVCRPTLARDKEAVLELSSHIWEGNDYLPYVWDDWLADPNGMFGVAELHGRIAGVFKLTKFQDDEWYMEGLRVHPDFQGQGVASHIHHYVLDTWRRVGRGILRLTTASYNVKIHRMCEQSGFQRTAEFIAYRAPADVTGEAGFRVLTAEEAPLAMDSVLASPVHALSHGLINLGWVYADLQLKHISKTIEEQHAWWWRGGRGFISIWEDDEDDERYPGIQLVACPVDELSDLLGDYRHWMGQLGYNTAGWVAPNQPEVIEALGKNGFERSWDVSLYIYELRTG